MEGNALIFPKLEVLDGAGGGTRTLTPFLAPDFESGASTSSTTPAKRAALSMMRSLISTTIPPLQNSCCD